MRLLDTETYVLKDFGNASPPQYAILSHRWYQDGEITYQMLNAAELLDRSISTVQLNKIRGACQRARASGLKWVWIDSCCFNKESSEETTRSINSMFMWYQQAAVCYAYLTDVDSSSTKSGRIFQRQNDPSKDSEWFERGWALQELLAPTDMEFFDKDWRHMGSRASLASAVSSASGIDEAYLQGTEAFRSASIATRLSWQARRTTTQVEDIAYSLVGILGVHLVPTYGEGRAAWMRLQEAVLQVSTDESLFAWTAPAASGLPPHSRDWPADEWGLLAPWVDCFADSRDVRYRNPGAQQIRSIGGTTRVPGGVRFPILLKNLRPYKQVYGVMSAFMPPFIGPFLWLGIYKYRHATRKEFQLTLNCWKTDPQTGKLRLVELAIRRDGKGDAVWRRARCGELGLAKGRVKQSPTVDVVVLQPEGLQWNDRRKKPQNEKA